MMQPGMEAMGMAHGMAPPGMAPPGMAPPGMAVPGMPQPGAMVPAAPGAPAGVPGSEQAAPAAPAAPDVPLSPEEQAAIEAQQEQFKQMKQQMEQMQSMMQQMQREMVQPKAPTLGAELASWPASALPAAAQPLPPIQDETDKLLNPSGGTMFGTSNAEDYATHDEHGRAPRRKREGMATMFDVNGNKRKREPAPNPGLNPKLPTFEGIIKQVPSEDSGFGFIKSAAMNQLHGRDAFLHNKNCPWIFGMNLQQDQTVLFQVEMNERKQPAVVSIVNPPKDMMV